MFFKYRLFNNPILAEKLMFGSTDKVVANINEQLWKKFNGNRFDYYLYIVKLCGKPITPRARYVIAMAYSWNSVIYCKEQIYYLNLYLSKPLYAEKCRSNGIYSTKERTRYHLTEMYNYLGKAYRNNKDYDNAIKSYQKSIEYTPNSISAYLNMAEIYAWEKDFSSALALLEHARNSKYAKFDDDSHEPWEIYLSINTIDHKIEEYKQKLYIETKYPFNQKQTINLVISNLANNHISLKFTQPQLKLICDYFDLKSNEEYFYIYANSTQCRCSQCLVDFLTNLFLDDPNIICKIKEEIKNERK